MKSSFQRYLIIAAIFALLLLLFFYSKTLARKNSGTISSSLVTNTAAVCSFSDSDPFFKTVLNRLGDPATITVHGGGQALVQAVSAAADGAIIEIKDSKTYDGGAVITDKSDIIIRAADKKNPIIDCGVLPEGGTCLQLRATSDRAVKNIGIKGLRFKNIRFNNFLSAATGHGIASFGGILESVVIEDNIFDNSDPLKDQSYKGAAIHINRVDGLLVRGNTIINGALNSNTSPQEDGAITLHEFLVQPNYLNNIFIKKNLISFNYIGSNVTAGTRGIVLAHIGKATERFNNIIVESNLIENVQKEAIKIYGVSSDPSDDETARIINNLIKKTSGGIEIDGGNVDINKVIFDSQVDFGSEGKNEAIDHDGGTVTVSNTIVYNKETGITGTPTVQCADLYNVSGAHPASSVSAIVYNVDPMFLDSDNYNYTITNANFPPGCNNGSFGMCLPK